MIVGVGRTLAKSNWSKDCGVVVGDQHRCRCIVEKPCVSEVIGQLTAKFDTTQKSVLDPSGKDGATHVSLIEDIQALRGVVVRAEGYLRLVRCGRSRHI